MACCLGLDLRMHNWGGGPGAHKELLGATVLNSSHSMISLVLSSSLGLSSLVLHPRNWGIVYSILQLPCSDDAHIQGQAVKGQRVMKQWFKKPHTHTQQKRHPTWITALPVKKGGTCGLQRTRTRENRVAKRGTLSPSFWVLGDPHLLLSLSPRVSWSLCLHQCPPQSSGCLEERLWGAGEGKS